MSPVLADIGPHASVTFALFGYQIEGPLPSLWWHFSISFVNFSGEPDGHGLGFQPRSHILYVQLEGEAPRSLVGIVGANPTDLATGVAVWQEALAANRPDVLTGGLQWIVCDR